MAAYILRLRLVLNDLNEHVRKAIQCVVQLQSEVPEPDFMEDCQLWTSWRGTSRREQIWLVLHLQDFGGEAVSTFLYCSWIWLKTDASALSGEIMMGSFPLCSRIIGLQVPDESMNEAGRFFLGTSAVSLSSKGRQLQVLQTCLLTASFRLVSG